MSVTVYDSGVRIFIAVNPPRKDGEEWGILVNIGSGEDEQSSLLSRRDVDRLVNGLVAAVKHIEEQK